jgi:hypothetical protein
MSGSHQPENLRESPAISIILEDLIVQRFSLLSALVVLAVVASGLIVGFRWWALNIHP